MTHIKIYLDCKNRKDTSSLIVDLPLQLDKCQGVEHVVNQFVQLHPE